MLITSYALLVVILVIACVIYLAGGLRAILPPAAHERLVAWSQRRRWLQSLLARGQPHHMRVMVTLIKIVASFGQCVMTFLRFFQAEWPPALYALFEGFAFIPFFNFNLIDVRSFECATKGSSYYAALRFAMLAPLGLFATLLLLLLIARLIARATGAAELHPPLTSSTANTNAVLPGAPGSASSPGTLVATQRARSRFAYARRVLATSNRYERWGMILGRRWANARQWLVAQPAVRALLYGADLAWSNTQLWTCATWVMLLLYPSLCVASLSVFDTTKMCTLVPNTDGSAENLICTIYMSEDTSLVYGDEQVR